MPEPVPRLRRGVAGWFGRLPRWVRAAVGALAAALGVVLVVRPTTSLGVLALLVGIGLVVSGVVELVDGGPRVRQAVRAAVWVGAGLVVLAWPGLTVRLLAVVVGVGLVVNGVLSVASGVRRRDPADARVAAVASGVAEIVFGVLALLWPDITLLVVAVVFGARLVMAGVTALWQAVHRATSAREPARRRRPRTVAALVPLGLAGGAAVVSAALHDGSPVVDAFYAPPRGVPDEPGRLVRSEPFTRDVPAGAMGWRILYTTTRGDGSATVASGLVVVPRDGDGPWPVVDWAHGTTGFAQGCAPSLADHPFESGALFLLDQVVTQGWALAATDYIGLGTRGPHPYLVGVDTGHAVLDAARAARELSAAHLGDQHVVWGHSQGGGGALWTGAVANTYAPDLDVEGVAALAPAANLVALVRHLPDVTGGSVFASFVVAAYTQVYDDVSVQEYIRPGAQVTVREMATRCLAEPGVLVSVLQALALSRDPDVFAKDPTTGPLGQRIEQNVPPATVTAPLLLAQAGADRLVITAAQDEYVDGLCAAGEQVDYRTYTGLDHMPLVQADSPLVPELLAWTHDRFARQRVEPGCVRSTRP